MISLSTRQKVARSDLRMSQSPTRFASWFNCTYQVERGSSKTILGVCDVRRPQRSEPEGPGGFPPRKGGSNEDKWPRGEPSQANLYTRRIDILSFKPSVRNLQNPRTQFAPTFHLETKSVVYAKPLIFLYPKLSQAATTIYSYQISRRLAVPSYLQ